MNKYLFCYYIEYKGHFSLLGGNRYESIPELNEYWIEVVRKDIETIEQEQQRFNAQYEIVFTSIVKLDN